MARSSGRAWCGAYRPSPDAPEGAQEGRPGGALLGTPLGRAGCGNVPPRLRHGPGGHRLEEADQPLQVGNVQELAEGQEPRVPAALMAISRRARDREGKIIEPMTLANMRENGVGSVVATCAKCRPEGVLDVQRWPADTPVPDVGP